MNTFDAAVNVLRRHNRWRRGDDTVEAVDPALLGCAIDTVCDHIEKQAKVPDDVARDAAIGAAVLRACGELPEGFKIAIDLENGAGSVELLWDDERYEPEFDLPFSGQIHDCIDHAMLAAKAKGGGA